MKAIRNNTSHQMAWEVRVSFLSSLKLLGMYANEEDVYGDEIDADEDKNDGLNALVLSLLL
jgi:hypothetical protein